MTQTVLIIGSTGHIGVSAVKAALDLKFKVLAIIRNETSAQKIYDFIGSKEGITTVTTDVLAETGVAAVVEQVKAGKLPSFQHVTACAGGGYTTTSLLNLSPADMQEMMRQNYESNFLAYRYTMPYLLELGVAASFTLCTGAQGDICMFPGPAMTQGALYSMATAACRENAGINFRFNEIYTNLRVEVDPVAIQHGTLKSSEYAKAWHFVLADDNLRGARVFIEKAEDPVKLNARQKVVQA